MNLLLALLFPLLVWIGSFTGHVPQPTAAADPVWSKQVGVNTTPTSKTTQPEYRKNILAQVSPEQGTPHFRNVTVRNLRATSAARTFRPSTCLLPGSKILPSTVLKLPNRPRQKL